MARRLRSLAAESLARPRSIAFTFALALSLGLAAALAAGGCSKNKTTNPMTTTTTTETFNSGDLVSGTPFTHPYSTASTAGGFGYHCAHHAGMTGTVVVDASSANTTASVNVGGTTNVFAPSSVTIKPGGTVTWTLVSGVHTVTSP